MEEWRVVATYKRREKMLHDKREGERWWPGGCMRGRAGSSGAIMGLLTEWTIPRS